MAKGQVTKPISSETKRMATQRAKDRASAARWDLDIAVFLFAIVIIVIILSVQGIEIEVFNQAYFQIFDYMIIFYKRIKSN